MAPAPGDAGLREAPPVFACVLIGGRSRRMGRPKHLISTADGRTWLERTAALAGQVAEQVVIAGAGEVPESLNAIPRLPDAPGVHGPLAGILAAVRHAPDACWLVVACDMPDLTEEALTWLIDQRGPDAWAVQPRRGEKGVEPLLSLYEPLVAPLLEALAASGDFAPSSLAAHPHVYTPKVPDALLPAWGNVNTPVELAGREGGGD